MHSPHFGSDLYIVKDSIESVKHKVRAFFSSVKGVTLAYRSSDHIRLELENSFGKEFLVDVETRLVTIQWLQE